MILNSPFGIDLKDVSCKVCVGGSKSSCSISKWPFAPKMAGQDVSNLMIKRAAFDALEYWAALEIACHAAASGHSVQERNEGIGYNDGNFILPISR